MKTIAVSVTLLLVLLFADNSTSLAGEGCSKDFWGKCKVGRSWHHQGLRYRHCATDFWGRCSDGRPRWRSWGDNNGRDYHRGRDEVDRGTFCHPRRRVVGNEEGTREKARKAAEDAWMGSVRYDFGERFQDLNHAKDVRHNCDLSSKTLYLNRARFRCVVEATPCRAPTGSHEERVEQRYEEEGDK